MMRSEPWFFVGANDIFPEELPTFLFNTPKARELFLSMHGDLATAEFWQRKHNSCAAGWRTT